MTTQQKIIRNKVGLLELARTLGNVSVAKRSIIDVSFQRIDGSSNPMIPMICKYT